MVGRARESFRCVGHLVRLELIDVSESEREGEGTYEDDGDEEVAGSGSPCSSHRISIIRGRRSEGWRLQHDTWTHTRRASVLVRSVATVNAMMDTPSLRDESLASLSRRSERDSPSDCCHSDQ